MCKNSLTPLQAVPRKVRPRSKRKNYSEEWLNKTFLFFAISDAGDIGWDPNFEMGDGGLRITRIMLRAYFINPPLRNLGNPMAGPANS